MADNFETMNMKSMTVSQFTNLVREQLEDEDLTPIMGIGKSGVGKTESIFDLTKELGIGFCELRLVTMTETDLLGIPTINEFNRTDWASNNMLPDAKRDGEVGILVLDEITSATSTVRAAAYQLLDSKRALGNYKLPPKWIVVALGNGASDGGQFSGMEGAFLSRCRCWRIEPDLKTWKKWAVGHNVSASVLAFLTSMPEYLHKFDPNEMASVFPCPRSWTALSKKLNDRERRNNSKPLEQDMVDIYAAGCVGNDVAASFGAFYSYNKKTVNIEDILNGTASFEIGDVETQVMYIIVQNIVKALKSEITLSRVGNGFKSETITRVGNAYTWLVGLSNRSLDVSMMAFSDLATNIPEIVEIIQEESFDEACPSFMQFALDNSIILSSN